MKINKWKIATLTIVTWLALSILAKGYQTGQYSIGNEMDMYQAQADVWAFIGVLASIFVAIKLKSWKIVLFGIIQWIVTIILSVFSGVPYFAYLYYLLEKNKETKTQNQENLTV